MPPAAAVLVAGGLLAVGGSLSVIAANIAVGLLTNVALGFISKSLAKKPKQFSPAVNVTVKNSIENRRGLLGERRIGGSYVFINTSSTTGSNADILWYVIALTGHEIFGLTGVYLDNELVQNADIDPSTGEVTGSTRFVGKLRIFKFLGTSSQTAHADLNASFAEVDSNFRLRGCAYLILRMIKDDVAFFQGPPQSVTTIAAGAKAYDPRFDSTNGGVGSQRRTDPSTWGYTRNPAVLWRWYITGGSVHNTGETTRLIRYGLEETDDRIDDAYVIAAANICDEVLSGANAPPGGSTVRYQCDLEFSTGETHRTVLQEILDSMAGTHAYVHGKWRVYAGAYDTPLHSFTQEDLYGDLETDDTADSDERYNAVAAVFINRNAGWSQDTTPYRTNSSYETQDGNRRIPREIDLRGVTSPYQAQRIAEIELRKSRMMRTVRMVGSLNLKKVALHETFTLSHARYGWVNRVFRCIEKQTEFAEDAVRVTIIGRAESPGVYTDLVTADYSTGTSASDSFVIELPLPPTSLTSESQVTSVKLLVGFPASFAEGAVVEIFEHTAATPFSSATKVAEGRSNVFIIQRRDETTRFYWARIRNRSGALSTTFPASTGQSGVAAFAQSTDIAANAATTVIQARDLSEVVTNDAAVITISAPAQSVGFSALLTFTCDIYKSAGTSSSLNIIYLTLLSGGVPSLIVSEIYNYTSNTSAAAQAHVTLQLAIASLSAGVAYDFAAWTTLGQFGDPAGNKDATASNITLKLEIIKR